MSLTRERNKDEHDNWQVWTRLSKTPPDEVSDELLGSVLNSERQLDRNFGVDRGLLKMAYLDSFASTVAALSYFERLHQRASVDIKHVPQVRRIIFCSLGSHWTAEAWVKRGYLEVVILGTQTAAEVLQSNILERFRI